MNRKASALERERLLAARTTARYGRARREGRRARNTDAGSGTGSRACWSIEAGPWIRRALAHRQDRRRDRPVSVRSVRAARAPVRREVAHPDRWARVHPGRCPDPVPAAARPWSQSTSAVQTERCGKLDEPPGPGRFLPRRAGHSRWPRFAGCPADTRLSRDLRHRRPDTFLLYRPENEPRIVVLDLGAVRRQGRQ